MDPARSYLKNLAHSLRFSGPVVRPISEADFERRLRYALFFAVALGLTLVAVVFRYLFKRKKKTSSLEEAPSAQVDTIDKPNEKV